MACISEGLKSACVRCAFAVGNGLVSVIEQGLCLGGNSNYYIRSFVYEVEDLICEAYI